MLTLLGFLVWTAAVMAGVLDPLDDLLRSPQLDPRSVSGQIAEGLALVMHPFGLFGVTLLLALWALRRRLRRLALALTLSSLGLPAYELVATLCARPRPFSLFADSVSANGFGYPSGHIAAATVLTWVGVTIANAERRASRSARWRRVWGVTLVAAVAVGQWALGTQWVSDLVGGALLGATVASGALWTSGVDTIRRSLETRNLPMIRVDRRAAVVYNPTKIIDFDLFRRRVDHALLHNGWKPPLWLETTREDAGGQLARQAAAQGVDRVLVAGGDGTVRAVCAGLAGSGVPVGLVPAGTGNLLCRNLGVPLDEDLAIDLALNGTPTSVDMISCTTDGGPATFAVMSGLGLDALIMSETNPQLKERIKSGAYVLAAAQQLGMKPFRVRVKVDGRSVTDVSAVMALVGNVGKLQGGLEIFPEADPRDGLLDVLVASPEGAGAWARLVRGMGQTGPVRGLQRAQGRRVEMTAEQPVPYQLDGDTAGQTTHLVAEVVPGALLVMLHDSRSATGRPEPLDVLRLQ